MCIRDRGEHGSGLTSELPHARMLHLPPAAHLLDDELRVQTHLDIGRRVDRPRLAQARDGTSVLGHVVRHGVEVLGQLGEDRPGRRIPDDGAIGSRTGVAS